MKSPEHDRFEREEGVLRLRLLAAQRALRASSSQVVIIVSGVEGAGKTAVVNRLSEWLDARGVRTHSFWTHTEEERLRPENWRYWRRMPARGSVGVMFGSWYTQPIIDCATGDKKDKVEVLSERLRDIARFEQLLADDGVLLIKLWFHVDKKLQKKRIKQARKGSKAKASKSKGSAAARVRVSPLAEEFAAHYDAFERTSERAIALTDRAHSRWYVIDSADVEQRDLAAGRVIATSIERHLAGAPTADPSDSDRGQQHSAPGHQHPATVTQPAKRPDFRANSVLDAVDLSQGLSRSKYKTRLAAAQDRLYDLAWRAHEAKVSTVLVFEGWDAAGKGGAIRRLTTAMDARLYRVVPIAAPSDEERAQHYLWRFWRQLPEDGRICVFDRSWYGRVLVERVEAFATTPQWTRAYGEINDFERQLTEHGTTLAKFWLHISKDEQLSRFEQRAKIPWKQHKITEEDWRNREKWDAYNAAVTEMIGRTSPVSAPWTIVAGNDKKVARVTVVETVADQIERALARR